MIRLPQKEELLNIIREEKKLLSDEEVKILGELRKRILANPQGFRPISDAYYEVLSDQERKMEKSMKRIDYILSKEIEYQLADRSMSERMLRWLKENKTAILAAKVFGGLGAALSYYLDHKEEIDQLVGIFLGGGPFKKESWTTEEMPEDLTKVEPREIFQNELAFKELRDYLIKLATEGFRLVPDSD